MLAFCYTPVMTNTVPILAIDIDGVLNPMNWTKQGRKIMWARGFRPQTGWQARVRKVEGSRWIPHGELWLNRAHGEMLARFSREHDVELVWASLWEHNSNAIVAPALGLPRMPFVDFHGHPSGSQFWKFQAVADYARGRPLAWLDDSFGEPKKVRQLRASGWSSLRRNLPTFLQEVDPDVGVTRHDLDMVAGWLKTSRLAWPSMDRTYELPKPPVWHLGNQRRSTRKRFAFADIEHSLMSDEEFIDALALDGSPGF